MKNVMKAVLAVVLFFIAFKAINSFTTNQAESNLQNIQNKVALDAVKQYEIAKKQGDKIQIYVQAGLVAASYLQAKDEVNYNKWKAIEKEAAKEAGMPY